MNTELKNKKKREPWPQIKKVVNHGNSVYVCDARIKGRGERRFFNTKKEAEGWQQQQRIKRQNEGHSAFDNAALAKLGLTVADAIKFAIEHFRRKEASVTVAEAARQLIETKLANNRSKRYCEDLKWHLGKLAAEFEGRTMADITTTEIDQFLNRLNVSAVTRNTYRRDIRTLWSFAEKRGWAVAEQARNAEIAIALDSVPGILTVEEASNLLLQSKDDDLLAFHAIGLFAGLRVREIRRLDWRDVDLDGGLIHVGAKISKTRSRRLVPILENLKAWLQPIAKADGPVVERNLRKRHLEARARAGIQDWPANAMRHSFVSFRLAQTQNASQTALESGHDQAIFFAHYRELVKPVEAKNNWELAPTMRTRLPLELASVRVQTSSNFPLAIEMRGL